MKIVDYSTSVQNMNETQTVQNFGSLLGQKPHKLGQVVTLFPYLAISNLTDSLRNVFELPKGNKFTPIKSYQVEWSIDVNFVKKVYIAVSSTTTGSNQSDVVLVLKEKYYDQNDSFVLENRQQLYVTIPPRKVDLGWEYTCKLITNDLNRAVDTAYLAAGKFTRFRSNYYPELSGTGNVKYYSNTEIHRNYVSRHRASIKKSADYSIMESVYIEDIAKDGKRMYFKLDPAEKRCLNEYLLARENHLIFGESNFDINGKCMIQEDGKDVPMGDGVIPQIERYGEKLVYSILDTTRFEDLMAALVTKADMPTGNIFTLVMNERLYAQVNRLMKDDLRFQSPNDGSYYYSKGAAEKAGLPQMVSVGSAFKSYSFANNTITFVVDRALSIEYPDRGYGFILDTTARNGVPNLAMFTLEGSELVQGTLNGMGGKDGRTSGVISTPVHGSEYHLLGYSCAVLFNPYSNAILSEAIY